MFSFIPPSNSLVSIPDPWGDMSPFKGHQPCLSLCFRNFWRCKDTVRFACYERLDEKKNDKNLDCVLAKNPPFLHWSLKSQQNRFELVTRPDSQVPELYWGKAPGQKSHRQKFGLRLRLLPKWRLVNAFFSWGGLFRQHLADKPKMWWDVTTLDIST